MGDGKATENQQIPAYESRTQNQSKGPNPTKDLLYSNDESLSIDEQLLSCHPDNERYNLDNQLKALSPDNQSFHEDDQKMVSLQSQVIDDGNQCREDELNEGLDCTPIHRLTIPVRFQPLFSSVNYENSSVASENTGTMSYEDQQTAIKIIEVLQSSEELSSQNVDLFVQVYGRQPISDKETLEAIRVKAEKYMLHVVMAQSEVENFHIALNIEQMRAEFYQDAIDNLAGVLSEENQKSLASYIQEVNRIDQNGEFTYEWVDSEDINKSKNTEILYAGAGALVLFERALSRMGPVGLRGMGILGGAISIFIASDIAKENIPVRKLVEDGKELLKSLRKFNPGEAILSTAISQMARQQGGQGQSPGGPQIDPPDPSLLKKIYVVLAATGIASPTIDLLSNAFNSPSEQESSGPVQQASGPTEDMWAELEAQGLYDDEFDDEVDDEVEIDDEAVRQCQEKNQEADICVQRDENERIMERLSDEVTNQDSAEQSARQWLNLNGRNTHKVLSCKWDVGFGSGKISTCNDLPGDIYHCEIKDSRQGKSNYVLSIFACLCCDESGYVDGMLRGHHISDGSRTGRRHKDSLPMQVFVTAPRESVTD